MPAAIGYLGLASPSCPFVSISLSLVYKLRGEVSQVRDSGRAWPIHVLVEDSTVDKVSSFLES